MVLFPEQTLFSQLSLRIFLIPLANNPSSKSTFHYTLVSIVIQDLLQPVLGDLNIDAGPLGLQ